MAKKPKSVDKIKQNLLGWSKDRDIAEFVKERLGLGSEGKDKMHVEEIIDNAIEKAKYEEKPEWTALILKSIEEPQKIKGPTVNVFAQIAESTNEGIDKLIDVTPEKKKEFFDII